MSKYPIALPYIHTADAGKELRYSIRSYQNIKNWNGDIFVIGDNERWFSGIYHIPKKRRFGTIYLDQARKMRTACELLPKKFIASMDDIYCTTPTEIGIYNQGLLTGEGNGPHKRSKKFTMEYLQELGIEKPLDFELHAPMLVDRDDLKDVLDLIISHPQGNQLQWRSMYGNMCHVSSEFMEDGKTKTAQLKDGNILSTNFYTDELQTLFSIASIYEL